MTDTAREPIAHLWQHKETGRVYYQGPHDEAPQSTHALIGPLFLGASIPPREPTEDRRDAARYRWLRDQLAGQNWEVRVRNWVSNKECHWLWCDAKRMNERIDAAMAEKEGK